MPMACAYGLWASHDGGGGGAGSQALVLSRKPAPYRAPRRPKSENAGPECHRAGWSSPTTAVSGRGGGVVVFVYLVHLRRAGGLLNKTPPAGGCEVDEHICVDIALECHRPTVLALGALIEQHVAWLHHNLVAFPLNILDRQWPVLGDVLLHNIKDGTDSVRPEWPQMLVQYCSKRKLTKFTTKSFFAIPTCTFGVRTNAKSQSLLQLNPTPILRYLLQLRGYAGLLGLGEQQVVYFGICFRSQIRVSYRDLHGTVLNTPMWLR